MMPMKTKSVFLLLWVAVFSLFTSCKNNDETDNVIWDIYPIEFHIYVQDAAGRDLLNPETENNILEQDIRAIYDQKEYKLGEKPVQTRAIYAPFMGLQTTQMLDGRYCLTFGYFLGDIDWGYTPFSVKWGDGTIDHFSFDSKMYWKDGKPEFNRHFYLNEVEYEKPQFTLVKEPYVEPPVEE